MEVYLDNNATTPLRGEVLEVMMPFLRERFGNPSSAHSFGRTVREAVEEARHRFASVIGAKPREIIFTSGGTEADNLALFGVAYSEAAGKRQKLVVSAIEHPAVLRSAQELARRGFEVHFLPVDETGTVNLDDAERLIDERTLLVSVMLANNEVGTIQPVQRLVELAHAKGALVHTDAVQALGKIEVNVKALGVDFASFSSHKVYGPKGVGALYIKTGKRIKPLFYGGHQERNLRVGTENPAGIVGFAYAAELAVQDVSNGTMERIGKLRDMLEQRIVELVPHVLVNGRGAQRVPNTTNLSFAFVEGEGLTLALDAKGVAVSTGSACSSGTLEPSHVLLAMGLPAELAHGSVRFSLGISNTQEQIEYAVQAVHEVVERLRSFSPLYEDFVKSGLGLEDYLKKAKQRSQTAEEH